MLVDDPSRDREARSQDLCDDDSRPRSDNTLRVTNRATNEAGETEVQVYERSLRQGGMDLYFTRYDDDRLARIVQGRLERASLSPGEPAPWC